jgi:hypothetical protein
MGDAMEIDGAASPHHADDYVTLFKQKFGQIRSILAGNSGYQCFWQNCSPDSQLAVRPVGVDLFRS